jgi:WD40 repeat protein
MGVGIETGGPASYAPDLSLIALSKWKYLEDGDVTIGRVRSLIMMDVATGRALYTVEDIGLYSFVTFSPDGSLLITGSSIRNPSTGEILRTLDEYPASTQEFAFSPDGTMFCVLASGDSNQYKVNIWDVATGDLLNLLNVFEGHESSYPITNIAWSPDGTRMATSAMDKTAVVWDAKTGELLQKITGMSTEAIQIEFSTDGNTIFALTEDAHIVAWDVQTGNQLRDIRSVSNIRKLAWRTDSAVVAALSVNDAGRVSTVYIWDVQTEKWQDVRAGERFPPEVQVSPGGSSDRRMISADGSMIASVEPYGSQLEIKDAVTNEIIFSSPVYTASGKSIAWSPTKPILAVTDGTAQVLIWNAETGETKINGKR